MEHSAGGPADFLAQQYKSPYERLAKKKYRNNEASIMKQVQESVHSGDTGEMVDRIKMNEYRIIN